MLHEYHLTPPVQVSSNLPLVNEGEALFHIAGFKNTENVLERVEEFQNGMDPNTDVGPSSEPPIV